jgi:antitoxin ParD1/3/4
MATIEKISVALPADMLQLVKQAVKSGDYATTSEVIREALREWKGRRQDREESLAELRRLVQAGLDSPVSEFEPGATKREGRRILEHMRKAQGKRGR